MPFNSKHITSHHSKKNVRARKKAPNPLSKINYGNSNCTQTDLEVKRLITGLEIPAYFPKKY